MSVGVDGLLSSLGDAANPCDDPILDRYITPIARTAGAINNHAILDNNVVGHFSLP